MTEREIIEAILANRDDREAFRVYADWLEAQGDPRGALISMELALAEDWNQDLLRAVSEHVQRYPTLAPGSGETKSSHGWKWGAIDEIRIAYPTPEELANLIAHPACATARSLRLTTHNTELAALLDEIEQAIPTIEQLALTIVQPPGAPVEPASIDAAIWDRLPRLVHLEVGGPFPITGPVFSAIRSNLRALTLSCASLTEDPVWELPAVTRVTWSDVETLEQLEPLWRSELSALREVKLSGLVWPERYYEHAGFMTRLARLDDAFLEFASQGGSTSFHPQREVLDELRAVLRPGQDVREAWAALRRG